MTLREIAEQLGISHQRVHQIVGVVEERPPRRKLIGGVAGLLALLVIGGLLAIQGGQERAAPQSSPSPSMLPGAAPCLALVPNTEAHPATVSFRLGDIPDCKNTTVVTLDPDTGAVLAIVSIRKHGEHVRLTYETKPLSLSIGPSLEHFSTRQCFSCVA